MLHQIKKKKKLNFFFRSKVEIISDGINLDKNILKLNAMKSGKIVFI